MSPPPHDNIIPTQGPYVALSKISITIPTALLYSVDKKRGDVARSRFIAKVLQKYIDKGNGAKLS